MTSEAAAGGGRPPVEAVLFDLGNVLVRWDPHGAFRGVTSRDDVERFFADVDFPDLNRRADAGLSWTDVRAEVAASHPAHAPLVDTYVARFAATLAGPVPGSEAIVRELGALGLRLFGLTNWSAETYPHGPRAAPAIDLLADVLVSGQEGLVKPDPAIFELAAERFGLDPARTVFVDDAPANVAAAARSGFVAVRFTTADALRGALRGLGLRLAAS
ncbi:haloacid dehalogenase [Luteimicrobium album]|uniref:Haloacid dehalogenase n=1 Tax=Luteimicrobium album TaxID=1054550 RepID=A0ABQ6I5B7_9MICO|nr:HAD-IA family hydrolase [Luteimicrobium album]GMA25931.1 haloacid dehalogenase [Luteimicrobium album]